MANPIHAQEGGKVRKVLGEFKRGTLRSGQNGRKVTKRAQAIAIGLSEARKAGEDVPPPRRRARRGGRVRDSGRGMAPRTSRVSRNTRGGRIGD